MSEQSIFFRMRNIVKNYSLGEEIVTILKGINLDVQPGEYLSVLGPSGSGKSTLMNIVGFLDQATEGEYILQNQRIADLDEKELSHIRSREIGFIFQNSQMMARLDAMKNVELPLIYAGVRPRERVRRAEEMLVKVGLRDRLHHTPNQLSGGQQQRTAIGRAIVKNPDLLLCDEPTGALDYNTSKEILKLIETVNQKYGNTIVMVTHNDAIKDMADRVVKLRDGMIRKNYMNEHKIPAAELDW